LATSGHFGQIRPLLRGLFYINPSRRGPVAPFRGFSGGEAQKGLKSRFLGNFPKFGENGDFRAPEGFPRSRAPEGSPRGQGPGARG